MRVIPLMLAAAAAAAASAAPASAGPVSALGTWKVTRVEADPSMPVTAVVDNDPAYLGAGLTITSSAITWSAKANGSGTYDDCAAPRFRPADGGLAVTCGGAAWGPEAVLQPLSTNELRLSWYDGGILYLTRH